MADLLRAHADVRLVSAYDVETLAAALQQLVDEHARGALAGPTCPGI